MFPCPCLNLFHSQCQNFSYDIRDLSSCTSVPRKGSGEWERPNCPPQELLTTQPSLELLPWPSACLPACSHTWGSCASSTLKGAHILNLRAFLLSFFFLSRTSSASAGRRTVFFTEVVGKADQGSGGCEHVEPVASA